jgi:predicted transcriptional regulator
MLGVETRFMIKDMYRKGISISEIARQTGYDRKTVRKVIKGDLIPSGETPATATAQDRCVYGLLAAPDG